MPRKKETRQDHEARFLEEIEKLNPAQRQAVDALDGPVLVVAGPGTGKTHILSARIGQILKNTDTKAHNILCLTYTDAATHAMRDRLLQFIGPESHKLHIYTFHSFCNNVIQSNLSYFGLRDLEAISKLERIELIQDILENLPPTNPLKPLQGDGFYYEKHLEDLFDRMKSEDWTVELIKQRSDEYIASLKDHPDFIYKRNGKGFKKGDLKQKKIDKEQKDMDKLFTAAKLFRVYEQQMRRKKRYDFADMILWVLKAFRQNEDLIRRYQEQYLYILVDEFQDTNGAQNQLLSLLIDFWETPNVFVVGDDDQSIYEFQGARVKNILDFHQKYADSIELVVLTENYRSSQHILDASKSVINLNELRLLKQLEGLELNKELSAANKHVAKLKRRPVVAQYRNQLNETADLVAQIKALIKKGTPPGEIAVIYYKHKQAIHITRLLENEDVPYHTRRSVDILEQPLIKNVLTFLAYLQKEYELPHSGESLLYQLLHVNFLGIDNRDIASLAAFMANDKSEKRRQNAESDALPWRVLMDDEKRLHALRLHDKDAIIRLSQLINQLLSDYINVSLPQLLERLVNHSGLLRHITSGNEQDWNTKLVFTLFDFVRAEAIKNPQLDIRVFLEMLHRMKDNRIPLGLIKSVGTESGGVNLVTAHSSKGLEFGYVFMMDCTEEWEPTNTLRNRFKLPPNLTVTSGEQDSNEAARRLFYVAMTRAKRHLHISFSKHTLEGKPRQAASYVDELLANTDLELTFPEPPGKAIFRAQLVMLTETEKPVLKQPFSKEELNAMLEGLAISASSLSTFLDCPLSFYFQYVLKVPTTSSEAAAYGSAIHYAVERLFIRMKGSKTKSFPSIEQFIQDFEKEMARQRIYFTEQQYQRRLAKGRLHLPDYYATRIVGWHKKVELEAQIRNVEMDGIPLSGIVDKIEIHPNNLVHVVDYKTGAPRREKTNPPNNKHPQGGDYWRQIIFYKILLENYRNNLYEVKSGEIDYTTPDRKDGNYKRVTYKLLPEEVKFVRQQVKDTYASIRAHDFFEGCGKPDCKWCNFTREHLTEDSMRLTVVEEMDE